MSHRRAIARVVPVAVLATLGLLTVASACSNDDGGATTRATARSRHRPAVETSSDAARRPTAPPRHRPVRRRMPGPGRTRWARWRSTRRTDRSPSGTRANPAARPARHRPPTTCATYLPPAEQAKVAAADDIVFTTDAFTGPAGGGAREPAVPARAVQPRLLRLPPAVLVPHHRHGLVGLRRRRTRALGPRPHRLPDGHDRPGRQHRRGRPAGGHPRDGGGEPARRRGPSPPSSTPAGSPWSGTRPAAAPPSR